MLLDTASIARGLGWTLRVFSDCLLKIFRHSGNMTCN
jgi:hypothetical protein